MSELTLESVQHLASLCRIRLTEKEALRLLEDLDSILGYVGLLNELDTQGVNPCHHVIDDMVNVFREDEVKEPLDREAFLDNAPDHTDRMIRVPSIIKKS